MALQPKAQAGYKEPILLLHVSFPSLDLGSIPGEQNQLDRLPLGASLGGIPETSLFPGSLVSVESQATNCPKGSMSSPSV